MQQRDSMFIVTLQSADLANRDIIIQSNRNEKYNQ